MGNIEKINIDEFIEQAKETWTRELKRSGMTEEQAEMLCKIWGMNEYDISQFEGKEEYKNVMFWVNDSRERMISNYLKCINAFDKEFAIDDLLSAYFKLHSVKKFYEGNTSDDISTDLIYYNSGTYDERSYYFIQNFKEEEEIFLFKVEIDVFELRITQMEEKTELYNKIIFEYTENV
nr:MAG TPA: hypothetical protein [Bacteriophage sp.]